ncbi:MAG TPA: transporter substrate-binding domain-containing protein [Roseiarcus sp.]|nr:transporter substrate-binding domain-containing protein [Roseiarcus sp.]
MRNWRASLISAAILAIMGGAGHAQEALRICVNEDAPPYSARHKTGGAGFDLAVAGALAQKLGRPLQLQWFETKLDDDSSATLDANALLSDGRCQLLAGYPLTEDGLGKPGTATARLPDFDGLKPADRRRRIALGTLQPSKPYHFAPLTVVLGGGATGKTIKTLGDLEGVKIGVEGGTLSDTILMTYGDGRLIDGITHLVPGRAQLWPGLERGDFDAALVPLHRFDAYRAEHPDTKVRPSEFLYPVGFNIGFVGLARDASLLAEVDAALAQMLASGEIAKLAAPAGMTYLSPRAPDVLKPILLTDLKSP